MSEIDSGRAVHTTGVLLDHYMVAAWLPTALAELSGLLLIYLRLACEIHSPPQPSRRLEGAPHLYPRMPLMGIGDVKAVSADYPTARAQLTGPETDEIALVVVPSAVNGE